MANVNRGEVEITLDGETFTLRPTFSAMSEIEFLCDLGIQGIAVRLFKQNLNLKQIAAIIYGGMCGVEKPKYTLDQVGEKIMKTGIYKVIPVCAEFMAMAMQGDDAHKDSEEKKT